MPNEINQVVDGYGESDKISQLQRIASEVAAGSGTKVRVIGNVVKLEDSEKLGPQAYKTDDMGMKASQLYAQSYGWHTTHSYEGALEGRVSDTNPSDHYLLWLFKDGNLYTNWVKANYEQMLEETRRWRDGLAAEMRQQKLEQKFHDLLTHIQINKQSKS